MQKLTDGERATLFVYLGERSYPPWATGAKQHVALALLCGWTESRAKRALKQGEDSGYLDTPRKEAARLAQARARLAQPRD